MVIFLDSRVLREFYGKEKLSHPQVLFRGWCIVTTRLHPSPHQRSHSSKSKPKIWWRLLCFYVCFCCCIETSSIKRLLNLFSVSLNDRHVEVEITLIVSSQTNLHNLLCLYYQNHCKSEYINLNVQYSSRLDRKIFV